MQAHRLIIHQLLLQSVRPLRLLLQAHFQLLLLGFLVRDLLLQEVKQLLRHTEVISHFLLLLLCNLDLFFQLALRLLIIRLVYCELHRECRHTPCDFLIQCLDLGLQLFYCPQLLHVLLLQSQLLMVYLQIFVFL